MQTKMKTDKLSSNWTLKKKILIGYGIALILILAVLAWAILNLVRLGDASDAILQENYKSIIAAEKMVNAIERQDSAALLYLLGFIEEGVRQFRENEMVFIESLGRAKDNITIEGEADVLDSIDKGFSSYLINFSELRILSQNDQKNAASFYHEQVLPSFISVRDSCIQLREINEETMVKASSQAKSIAERAIWSMSMVGLTALTLGLVFSLILSNLLTRPLAHIMGAVQKVAEGNYNIKIESRSSDELGHLASEFNAMVQKLKEYHDLNIGKIVAEKSKSDAIIRGIDDGIIVFDSEFKVTGINPAAAKALDIDPSAAINSHFLEVIKSEKLFDYIKHAAEHERSPHIEEGKDVLTIGEDENQRHYQFFVTPIRAKSDSMIGVTLLLRDITRLKELDRLKSEFVMKASHELRTPLTSIGMSINLLLERALDKLNPKEQQLLSAANEDLQRLKALVEDLLTLSKIESGKIDLEFENVSMPTIFEKTNSLTSGLAEEKSIKLEFQAPEGLPSVKADLHKIILVLTNLISNAVRHTKSGGNIEVSASQSGSQIQVEVKDNGEGIPYEFQSRIFDKFVQADDFKDREGTGLGLAICKEIVRAHGGLIWVDSAPGEGSTFAFTLPVAE